MNDVRRKIGSALAAALLLAAPATAPAQMTGSRLGGTRVDIPDDITGVDRQSVAIRQMGDCIVRADPAAADSLIASEIQSEREKAAFQALIAKIPDCITQGVTLKMNTLTLHGIVSESLYRLAEAARNNPTATGQ